MAKNEKLAKAKEATVNGEDEVGDFQIRPSLNNSFHVAKVKEIIVDAFQQVLDGTYTNEASHPYNCFNCGINFDSIFFH